MSGQCGFPAAPQPSERQFGPLTGSSRKLDGEWGRIIPGLEGRLLASGRRGGEFAWIDVRPERESAVRPATLFDDVGGAA